MDYKNIGILLLAAGSGSRFGETKQLAKVDGVSLVKHVAVTAILSDFPTVVVLGSSYEEVRRELADLDLDTVINERWEEGIGTSIATGIEYVREKMPDLRAVIVMLADQPGISTYTLLRLAKTYDQTGMSIVASSYEHTVGAPALFSAEMFDELLDLGAEKGAKHLIQKFEDSLLAKIDAPEAANDIDTPEDLQRFEEKGSGGAV